MADAIYFISATPQEWDDFDLLYPDQGADDGQPYCRRFPRRDIPEFIMDVAGLEMRAYSCDLDDIDGALAPAIAAEPVANRGYTSRQG